MQIHWIILLILSGLIVLVFFIRRGLFRWGCWGWNIKCFFGFHRFKHESEIVDFSGCVSWDTCERCGLTINNNSPWGPTWGEGPHW